MENKYLKTNVGMIKFPVSSGAASVNTEAACVNKTEIFPTKLFAGFDDDY